MVEQFGMRISGPRAAHQREGSQRFTLDKILATEARLWLEGIDYERNRVEQAMRAADRAREAEEAAAADDDAPEDVD